jgi:mono/diheme cytochrome c family protein
MKTIGIVCGVALLAVASVGISTRAIKQAAPKPVPSKADQKSAQKAASHQSGDVARGKYLVEDVAMCGECHTPRDASGNSIEERDLQGAPTWIAPVHADPNWAWNAPTLAGFGGYSDTDAVNILEKGIGANGQAIQRPMHIYHMSHEDALAVVAYLKSLPTKPQQ